MNLNFYNPHHTSNLESLHNALQEQATKLDQLRNIDFNNARIAQPIQEQRYYVDCGKKEEWDAFLRLNYNLTETQIFDDYRLFLQAKAELHQDTNKEKLEAMKKKLSSPNQIASSNSLKTQANIPPTPMNQLNMENINANNTSNAYNQPINEVNANRLEKNTRNNENKGVKYVR